MFRKFVTGSGRQVAKAAVFGLVTLGLYFSLFVFEKPLLAISSHGGWYFIVPVGIAFVFSLAHGAFTGHFWDVLGIKARM